MVEKKLWLLQSSRFRKFQCNGHALWFHGQHDGRLIETFGIPCLTHFWPKMMWSLIWDYWKNSSAEFVSLCVEWKFLTEENLDLLRVQLCIYIVVGKTKGKEGIPVVRLETFESIWGFVDSVLERWNDDSCFPKRTSGVELFSIML